MGLSQTFAIIVFVVAAVFSVLLMTRTHVTEIPQKLSRFSGGDLLIPRMRSSRIPRSGSS